MKNLCKGFDSYENIIPRIAHTQISNDFLYDIGMINKELESYLLESFNQLIPNVFQKSIVIHPLLIFLRDANFDKTIIFLSNRSGYI